MGSLPSTVVARRKRPSKRGRRGQAPSHSGGAHVHLHASLHSGATHASPSICISDPPDGNCGQRLGPYKGRGLHTFASVASWSAAVGARRSATGAPPCTGAARQAWPEASSAHRSSNINALHILDSCLGHRTRHIRPLRSLGCACIKLEQVQQLIKKPTVSWKAGGPPMRSHSGFTRR